MRLITLVLILAAFLRLYGINWDSGYHLHPDERMLIMVADQINFFSNLNPNFFNYGSLPVYALKGVSQFLDYFLFTNLANYQGMLYVGRFLSVLADLGVVILVYKIANTLFKNERVGVFAALAYTAAFFPIQNTHFFVVDVFLNLFATWLVYLLILYLKEPSQKILAYIALVTAAAAATKVTAIIFLPIIGLVLLLRIKPQRISLVPFGEIIQRVSFFSGLFVICHFAFMPYAYLENERFINDILQQTKMNSDPYIFPYTLQYVGTTPYLYYLKNIFLWGLGPAISILSVVGMTVIARNLMTWHSESRSKEIAALQHSPLAMTSLVISVLFYVFYFLIIGKSAVKFMRYMLLMYPFFCLFAGYAAYKLCHPAFNAGSRPGSPIKSGMTVVGIILLVVALVWTLLFVSIYTRPHTRIAANAWILKNIPRGSTIAVEHWDDRLPLDKSEQYNIVELQHYNQPDDSYKWGMTQDTLRNADYLIVASNRLYIPLQRLTDCNKYNVCYPRTAQYYKDLFAGKLPFKKIAEFEGYPGLKIKNVNLKINDDSADESFTVYDHPKIMIFQKK